MLSLLPDRTKLFFHALVDNLLQLLYCAIIYMQSYYIKLITIYVTFTLH